MPASAAAKASSAATPKRTLISISTAAMFPLCSYRTNTVRQSENRHDLTFGLERLAGDAQLAGPGGSPTVGVSDLSEWPAGQRAESVKRPADRHQRERRYILRDAEHFFDLGFAADVVGSDDRAEAESTACENDVLHGRVDAGAADAVGVGSFVFPADGDVWRQCLAGRQGGAAPAGEKKNGRLT